MPIIERDRSIIPACDVPLETFVDIVTGTGDMEEVGAYKIGPALTGRPGYDRVVEIARAHTNKPLIFDGQKWGTEIPDTAEPILRPVKESGIDAVILFPLSGKKTQESWIKTAKGLGLGVIVGGEMTHSGFLRSEGGYFTEQDADGIYRFAAQLGVNDFVVPGNKPESIKRIRSVLGPEIFKNKLFGLSESAYSFYSPGFVAQGGEISEGALAAGKRFHAIVGRGILSKGHGPIVIGQTVKELAKNLYPIKI